MNIEITKKVGDTEVKERIEGIITYSEAEIAILIIKRWKSSDKIDNDKTP